MGRMNYLAMKSNDEIMEVLHSDLVELKMAAKKLMSLTSAMGVVTSLFKWVASIAAIYLLILDRTNWRTNMLTALLIPYIFLSLPSDLFEIFRGEVGKRFALVAVVWRLFLPRHFPDCLEMPGSLLLFVVVSPNFFAITLRDNWVGLGICLAIGCYLLQEHVRATGGFRNSFTQRHGISNTMGIILLLVHPIWSLVTHRF